MIREVREMEEAKGGELKNVLMAKFKEGTSESQIEQLIQSYANLVNLVEPMKSFHWYLVAENQGNEIIKRGDVYLISNPSYHYSFSWGKELSIEKQEEGYTHVFETTFESVEGIAEYSVHPGHHDFAKLFLPNLEKLCFIAAPDQQVITLKHPTEVQAMLMKILSK